MTIISISNTDPRHSTLQKGFNLRWPADNIQGQSSPNGADNIFLCASVDDIISAAATGLKDGGRITVRSGGYCYEGFVSNKLSGESETFSIIDISMLAGVQYSDILSIGTDFPSGEKYRFKMLAGSQNRDNYAELYKATGKTILGGSCYSVGVGGNICGGGYGYLSRKYGLSCDWLSGVDILVPDALGTGLTGVHVSRHNLPDIVDIDDNGYLFRHDAEAAADSSELSLLTILTISPQPRQKYSGRYSNGSKAISQRSILTHFSMRTIHGSPFTTMLLIPGAVHQTGCATFQLRTAQPGDPLYRQQ